MKVKKIVPQIFLIRGIHFEKNALGVYANTKGRYINSMKHGTDVKY